MDYLKSAGYARFDHAKRTLVADDPISAKHSSMFELFSKTALQSAFPCIGAQKVIRDYRIAFCLSPESFNTEGGSEFTAQCMYRWSQEAEYELLKKTEKPTTFATCIIAFPHMDFRSESEAERQLWDFLGKIHRYDRGRYPWSSESSSFVYDERFSMSLGGYAQFILFLSPCAITPSRHFPNPILIFNPHFIFETMRKADIFAEWRSIIREREKNLQNGWRNPKLADYGTLREFEAPQYALTLDSIFDIGTCPFTGQPRPVNMPSYDMRGHPFNGGSHDA